MSIVEPENDVDVVIVGGGLAGLCALNAALEIGARATLIEKTSSLGGSTVLSSGLMAFADTDEQHHEGIEDSPQKFRADLVVTGLHQNDPALLDVFENEQYSTYLWLKKVGVSFGQPHGGSGQSVPRSHRIDTWKLVTDLARRARELGGQIEVGVSASKLLTSAGRVIGVTASCERGEEKIRAGAVVLTSGGFSRNEELLAKVAPAMAPALRAGGDGNTGDGFLMARAIGAGQADMAFVKGTFGIFPFRSSAEEGTGILVVYKGAIAVNGFGNRFIDESLPYKLLGDACLAQPASLAYQIFDAQVMGESESSVPIYDFRRRLDAGQIRQSETLEELAVELGIDESNLLETVNSYNHAIENGETDSFNRTTLCGGVGKPVALMKPPFYGYPSTTVVLATYCGVTVDRASRVTDVRGDAIPGLYAAGEVTGGFHGNGYVTGSSLGKSAVFGRIAGNRAAQFARSDQ